MPQKFLDLPSFFLVQEAFSLLFGHKQELARISWGTKGNIQQQELSTHEILLNQGDYIKKLNVSVFMLPYTGCRAKRSSFPLVKRKKHKCGGSGWYATKRA